MTGPDGLPYAVPLPAVCPAPHPVPSAAALFSRRHIDLLLVCSSLCRS